MKSIRINDYDIILKEGSESSRAIIILHGYGADYTDLAPLGEYMDPDNKIHWYFINGPVQLQPGGRAWYELDVMRFQISAANGSYEKWIESTKQRGAIEASDRLMKTVEEISQKHSELYIGGFSQGSMIAGEVAFRKPELFKKLVIMSGTYFGDSHWEELTSGKEISFDIFQDHGVGDSVLPISSAKKLHNFFKKKGYKAEFNEFAGGHEIPPTILSKIKNFLGV